MLWIWCLKVFPFLNCFLWKIWLLNILFIVLVCEPLRLVIDAVVSTLWNLKDEYFMWWLELQSVKLYWWLFYMILKLYSTVWSDQARPDFCLIYSSSCFRYSIWYGSCSQLEPQRCLYCSVMHSVFYSSCDKFPTVILVWYVYFANTGKSLDFLSLMHKTPFFRCDL